VTVQLDWVPAPVTRRSPILLFLFLCASSVAELAAQNPPPVTALPPETFLPILRAALTAEDSAAIRLSTAKAVAGYYMNPNVRYGMRIPGLGATECDADDGMDCYFGDSDGLVCSHGLTNCRTRREGAEVFADLQRELIGYAVRSAADRFVIGQAVYANVKGNWYPQALELAQRCLAESWWCLALEGHVYYEFGEPGLAAPRLLAALEAMPPEDACRWRDIETLLPSKARGSYRKLDCTARRAVEDRAWWLADPVYLDEGNDRFIAHLARRIEIDLGRCQDSCRMS
jgi:tetratricopeptide (TPR) repeat protein